MSGAAVTASMSSPALPDTGSALTQNSPSPPTSPSTSTASYSPCSSWMAPAYLPTTRSLLLFGTICCREFWDGFSWCRIWTSILTCAIWRRRNFSIKHNKRIYIQETWLKDELLLLVLKRGLGLDWGVKDFLYLRAYVESVLFGSLAAFLLFSWCGRKFREPHHIRLGDQGASAVLH